jgi:hypothetical protein
MLGWHFSAEPCLAYDDGRPIVIGETLTVDYEPILCKQGLHASKRIIDALHYAPGSWVWRVELGGDVIVDTDKAVATERLTHWGYDATDVLRRFARRCALDVVHLWDCPDIVYKWLRTGDESIRDAAYDAAAWDAAWAAAWDASWDAARAAAWDASWDAARAATRDAAEAAARAATRDAASYAAEAAAWSAAEAAARTKQNRRLTAMISAGRPS